jgi:hypothetical protein
MAPSANGANGTAAHDAPTGTAAKAEKEQRKREREAAKDPEHPRDRWEMAYVWAFLNKFAPQIIQKTQGLETAMECVLFPAVMRRTGAD